MWIYHVSKEKIRKCFRKAGFILDFTNSEEDDDNILFELRRFWYQLKAFKIIRQINFEDSIDVDRSYYCRKFKWRQNSGKCEGNQ